MFKVSVLDHYPQKSLARLDPQHYQINEKSDNADILLVRSTKLHNFPFPTTIKAIGRAGTGIDNIPVDTLTELGVPVFYAPGANANAVKELLLASLLMAYRNIPSALSFMEELKANNPEDLSGLIEKNKKKFSGQELAGKTMGIIGAGNIGVKVANMAYHLGMKVITFDPMLSITNALALMPDVTQADSVASLLSQADIISIHVPLIEETKHLINHQTLSMLKDSALLANFSRAGIVDESALMHALDNEQLQAYLTDFASNELIQHEKVICLPHLGASTQQAQENASLMVINHIQDFIESGQIVCSANFPDTILAKPASFKGYRLAIVNTNQPGVIAHITNTLSQININIERMVNTSNDHIAYNLVDVTGEDFDIHQVVATIARLKHIRNVRAIPFNQN